MIVIDAGNTNIVIGFYTKNKLIKIIRLKTEKKINITQKEINKFFKSNKKLINNLKDRFCILSSVVPSLNLIFKNIFEKAEITLARTPRTESTYNSCSIAAMKT